MDEHPDLLWTPPVELKENSHLRAYMHWLDQNNIISTQDYSELWQWSVDSPSDFWETLWTYFHILHDGSYEKVMSTQPMPGTRWFEGTAVNYAEHIFRNYTDDYPAIIFQSERHPLREVSWSELKRSVAAVAAYLKNAGIESGDRVVGYLPNCPESTIAFLAANAIGAVWSSTSPDFGVKSVIDRFKQIDPKVFFTLDGYSYGGKEFNREEESAQIIQALPSLTEIITIPYLGSTKEVKHGKSFHDIIQTDSEELTFTRVPFNDPIWVLYSSGTTGLPKPITHSMGGILLEHLKYIAFHNNVKAGDRCFWYTTTGWMMWNYITASLLCGGTVVQYDGSPGFPKLSSLWKFASETKINHFGTSAGFITACMNAGLSPKTEFSMDSLISIGSTGSPLPPEGFQWLYKEVKEDLWVASISGGTDVCSAFVGGNPLWPVYMGEIQCRALGCDLHAYNPSGKSVVNEVGEMVIQKPMPSMPIYFWNDPEMKRYTDSYFAHFEGVWRHGDWTCITDREGIVIYGRSDSTLNRGGVRIGTAEIYRATDPLEEITDSLIICLENDTGEFYMPLFVVLNQGVVWNNTLEKKVKTEIRQQCSPRHVPDEVIPIPEIPYTISGKKVEMPVKNILTGKADRETLNRDALKNPESLDYFFEFRENTDFIWQKN